ncbi:aminotransferase class I/II-fold pyridoxal phosphate-dependent enzyme [Streptomyces triticagri]|uniref:Histidinol-phosphate aminotransferase n=1 Tax=Streptomyces triticagri TaxID=2293568 RepID=A0A372M760_9ACTN|nr:histidinol-phosphate transaminase [Streptomyces triticagri]RFU86782.1 aminotransferase class I/II-fold pyridoxal phosphate-dependent enzyme [Streptomyces triticagri]
MTTVAGRAAHGALAANENPYPPLPSVRAALAEAAEHANRYPDRGVTALTARIAGRLGVPEARIVTGAGSVGVLHHLMQALLHPGDEVVFAWPSFEAYPHLTEVCRGVGVRVPLASSVHDPEALAAAVGERTRLLFVCNPNNPTGTVLVRAELERLLRRVPDRVTVVLDEAYREFVTDPQVPDGIALQRDHPNVVVLRTFSKAYGLAGLRVGYAVAPEPVAAAIRRTVVPFGVSAPAQLAAIASLDAERELMARVTALVAERERTWRALTGLGLAVPRSEANFLWLPLASDAVAFGDACAAAGLAVRVFAGEGVRVTVGDQEANDAVIEVARRHFGR